MDGNDTLTDDINYSEESTIPVVVNIFNNVQSVHTDSPPSWYEAVQKENQFRKPVRKTVRRDSRLEKSANLPVIAVANLRSLIPKVKSFVEKMHNHDISLGLLTEVWQKSENKKHIFEIEKMFHMEGLKYISTPRHSAKRGGGAAIVAATAKFTLE